MKELNKKAPSGGFFFNFYFHRFWRLTPPYMLVMMVYITLLHYTGDGPLWPQKSFEPDECRNNCWSNLLYINNLHNFGGGMCMGWSWYLANDMQFYVISPAIFLIMHYYGWFGVILPLLLTLGSAIAAGVLSSEYDLQANFDLLRPSDGDYFDVYYVKPYCRIGPYLVGMITGYILYRTDCKVYMSKVVVCLGWAVAWAVGLAVVYGLFENTNGHPVSTEVAALYNSLDRIAWGAAVCWVIFACATGYGGFINTLLSWKAFVPLSRLTYCTYLVHLLVIEYFFSSQRRHFYMDNTDVVFTFLGVLVMSMLVAFAASMAFEAPFMGLEKILVQGFKAAVKMVSEAVSILGTGAGAVSNDFSWYPTVIQELFSVVENFSYKPANRTHPPSFTSTIVMVEKVDTIESGKTRRNTPINWKRNATKKARVSDLIIAVVEWQNPLELFDDQEFYTKFRFTREGIFQLFEELNESLQHSGDNGGSLCVSMKVCLALRFFATGTFQDAVGELIGVTQPTAEMQQSMELYNEVAGLPNVFASVDGTHVKIISPPEDEVAFVNRKNYFSINAMIVFDALLRILHCTVNSPGSFNDARIIRESAFYEGMEAGQVKGLVLGNSAYPLRTWLTTPIQAPANPKQEAYNAVHARTRVSVEHCIGVLKQSWHCLHTELRITPGRCSRAVLCYAILHNKAVTLGLPNFQDDAVVVEPEINVGPDRVAGHPVAANAVRDRLVANQF
ncbi:hypothetical protein RRG08_059823 [Elysia crispata]|uniref:DDE Tnp4 domain-containing protein n=1 Tax=Elysia crispata TaxID=231223 RepID=A0AAE0ZCK4_9GAST|nr:hypothetical protein RRG08_059823 [Elysia crispata]